VKAKTAEGKVSSALHC